MVFKKRFDKQSHEHHNHNMQTEPYMAMPQAGRSPMNPNQQGQSSDSRAMTGPLYDPRKDAPVQQPPTQHSMYHQPQYNPYVGQMSQQTPYLNAYGAPQQQSPLMNQQYPQNMPSQQQNFQNNNYMPKNTPQPTQEDLKGLSFWQEDTDNTYHDEAEDNDDSASPIKFVLTILVLVVVSVILWLGYRFATQPQNSHIPLIQAETGIYKHRPEHPGGEYFPHQDMHVYSRLTPHQQTMVQQERILPQDYAYPTQEEMQQQEYYQQQGYGQQQQNYPVQEPQQQYTQPQYYQDSAQISPYGQQNLESVEQQRQQQHEQPVVQQDKSVPAQETIPSVAEVKKNIEEQAVSAKDNKAGVVDPASSFVEPVKKQVSAEKNESVHSKPLTVGYYMQLGGLLPSDKSAKNEWDRIRRKFTTELGDYKPILRSVDAGVKKKYRLLIGPFSNRNNALKKCMRVGNGCRVVQVG